MQEQQLNDLSIFTLRELARRTGVASPTSKRKDELIEEIIAIKEGKKQPVVSAVRQGRPPKSFMLNLDPVLEKNKKIFTLKQGEDVENLAQRKVCGYVEKLNNNVGFLWIKNKNKFQTYFMPYTAFTGNILSGDFVTAEMIDNGEGVIVKEIKQIENIDVNNFANRINYFECEHHIPTQYIHFKNENLNKVEIKYGENLYVYGTNNNTNTKTIIDLLNNCDADSKIYINLAMVEKNSVYLTNVENAETFTSSLTDEMEYSKRVLTMAIDRIIRLMEHGKNVVVAVDDMLTLFSVDANMLKQLMSLTKCSDCGSISIFAVANENKNLILLEKLADKKYCINNNELSEI